jgi:hypothetical protein
MVVPMIYKMTGRREEFSLAGTRVLGKTVYRKGRKGKAVLPQISQMSAR